MKPCSSVVLLVTLVTLTFLSSIVFAGTSIIINKADIDTVKKELILKGINFDAFAQPVVSVGDTLLPSQNCTVLTNEIKCSLVGTPAMAGGSWKVKVSAGNSPSTNAEIDVFNSAGIVAGKCVPGDVVECYSGDPQTRNIGLCKSGHRTCNNNGVWDACEGEILPQVEICFSGGDEDCDGLLGLSDPDCANECGSLTYCSYAGHCVDTANDRENCGGCDQICTAGTSCISGMCQNDPNLCAPGTYQCANICCPNGTGCLDYGGVWACGY